DDGLHFDDGQGGTDTGAPSISSDGIDAGGNSITNVADGTNADDAATVGQVQQAQADAADEAPVVYTDASGNKLAKADDGKWYDADDVNADGSVKSGAGNPTDAGDVVASMQDGSG